MTRLLRLGRTAVWLFVGIAGALLVDALDLPTIPILVALVVLLFAYHQTKIEDAQIEIQHLQNELEGIEERLKGYTAQTADLRAAVDPKQSDSI